MEYEITAMKMFCGLKVFVINGKEADTNDFGFDYDDDPENAPSYGCGDQMFKGKEAGEDILAKYKITKEEYAKIVSELEYKLSFGYCSLCS